LNQHNSPLLRLSAELRNRIYHYTFLGSTVELQKAECTSEFLVVSGNFQHTIPLLLACRQLHHEALSTFYELTTLKFEQPGIEMLKSPHPDREVPPALMKYHRVRLEVEEVNRWIMFTLLGFAILTDKDVAFRLLLLDSFPALHLVQVA
jgi:hypothetical protein